MYKILKKNHNTGKKNYTSIVHNTSIPVLRSPSTTVNDMMMVWYVNVGYGMGKPKLTCPDLEQIGTWLSYEG